MNWLRNTFLDIRNSWRAWRLRPGMTAAADLAEQYAYGHKNTSMLGPEFNSLQIAKLIRSCIR